MLSFVPSYQEVWPKHHLIPVWRISSHQRETTGHGKDQKRHMQRLPWQWFKDQNQGKHHQGQFPRCHTRPQKWKVLSFQGRQRTSMFTENPTIHHPSLKNIPNQSIRGSPIYPLTKNASITPKSIKMHLIKRGYHYNLSFNDTTNQTPHQWRNRQRNILWFNTARTWKQMSENASFHSFTSTSSNVTHFQGSNLAVVY